MKGIAGLLIALALGLAAAFFNYTYLRNKASRFNVELFVGVREGVVIEPGDTVVTQDVTPIPVPSQYVGNLNEWAYPYGAVKSVVGTRVYRKIEGPALVLREHTATPPSDLQLRTENERAYAVPIDTRRVISSLIQPGEEVDFVVTLGSSDGPTPADRDARMRQEIVGPYKVLAVGQRLGTVSEDTRNRGENTVTILVGVKEVPAEDDPATPTVNEGNGPPRIVWDDKTQRLMDLLEASGLQSVGVLLRPQEEK